MFKKKQPTTPGRNRPVAISERQRASVFSYHANRSSSDADSTRHTGTTPPNAIERRLQSKGRLKRFMRVLVLIAVLILVILNLIVGTSPRLDIPKQPAGNQLLLHSEDVYAQAAANIVSSSFIYRTKLTFNAKTAAEHLAKQFPELGNVIVSVPLIGGQPVFHLEPADLGLLYASKGGEVYVLSASGKALAPLSEVSEAGKLDLPTVLDQSGLRVTLGKVALPSTNIDFITEVVGQLQAKKLNARNLVLPPGGSELHVQVSGTAYTVKFNLHGDARAEVGAYLAVKEQLAKENKVPAHYIDVRVENRVYYK